jgi:hypothetical protein
MLFALAAQGAEDRVQVSPAVDLSIAASSLTLLVAARQAELRVRPGRAGDPSMIWSGPTPSARAEQASDVVVYGGLALAAGLPLASAPRQWQRGLTETLIMGEALTLNLAANTLIKQTWGESRPFIEKDLSQHSDEELAHILGELRSGDAYRSFYSGHTSTVAVTASGLSTLVVLRGQASPWKAAGIGFASGMAAGYVEGALRNAAWKHDRNDVWVGMVLGAACGVAVPLLHTIEAQADVSFWVGLNGGGLNARF